MSDKEYILSLIAQGEHEHQDFKYQISDARKIARSISAFANNSGGHLLIGVKDNGSIAGVKSEEEMYMIDQAATMYCRPQQSVKYSLFKVEGKSILKVDIGECEHKPVQAPTDNGDWKVFYRIDDENIMASSIHVKVLKRKASESTNEVLTFSDKEQQLLEYLKDHGGITITGFTRLAHCSRQSAEKAVVNLCVMNIVGLYYHDGKCLISLKNKD